MRRAVVSSIVLALAALGVACGTLLANSGDDNPPGTGGDGAAESSTADGGVVPRPPPSCPLFECSGEPCKDEDCDDDDRDFKPSGGTFERDPVANTCTLSTTGEQSVMSYVEVDGRTSERTYTVLALEVLELTADRTIARLSIEGAQTGERIVLRREAGAYRVCEENANGVRCSEPLSVTLPQTLHVFGTVTSTDPPRARFALATTANACNASRVIELTAPFPPGNLHAEVGCLDQGTPCSLRFDNAILYARPE